MLRSLQAGRALAAIAVVVFHLSLTMGLPQYGNNAVFREYTLHGNAGVDFFFVLSGFIIMLAHYKDVGQPQRWQNYIQRRLVRVFPIYWVYTALLLVLLALGKGGNTELPTDWQGWISSLLLIRFSDVSPPLPVAWTLFHEVAFYAVFSLLILHKRIGLIACAGCLLVAAIWFQFPAEDGRTPWNVYTSAYAFHFLFGVAAYWLYRRGGTGLAEFGLAVATLVLTFTALSPWRELQHITMALGFGLLLAAAAKLEGAGKLQVPGILSRIGDASYTIYLTHSKILGAVVMVATKLQLSAKIGGASVFFIALTAALVLGYVAYYVIERPLLRMLAQQRRKPAVIPAGAATL